MNDPVELARQILDPDSAEYRALEFPGMAHLADAKSSDPLFADGGCPMSRDDFEKLREWRERMELALHELATALVATTKETA
jgi:hypothetical protein